MNDALKKELSQQVATAKEVEQAKLLNIADIVAKSPLLLEGDEKVSPMVFSARLLKLDERNRYVWPSWCGTYAQHVKDESARKLLVAHCRQTLLLSSELDPGKTNKIWVAKALKFAEQQGWIDRAESGALTVTSETSDQPVTPEPLSTSEMAFCFAELYKRNEDQWMKALGKVKSTQWLGPSVHTPGRRGRGQPGTLWNPVELGAALVENGHETLKSVRSRFQTKPALIPWLPLWRDCEDERFSRQ